MKNILIIVSKKKLLPLILIPLLISALFPALISTVFLHENELEGKVIVIDAGHGGVDSGANNEYILEKDVNLDVALKLQKKLEKSGARVIMTRSTDTDLADYDKFDRTRYLKDLNARLDIINNSSADLFVSIHANSNRNNPSARGMMVFYYNSHSHNRSIAHIFQNIFNSYGFRYKGNTYKSSHTPQIGKYFLLIHSMIPGVLIETGFITNKTEVTLLQKQEYREYLSEAIYKGVVDYFLCRESLPDEVDKNI